MNIEPVSPPYEPGWAVCPKKFKAIGTCRTPRKAGGFTLYHVYGVRGDEIFVQHEGHIDAEGCIWGVSLLASDLDSELYSWRPRSGFERVRIDGEADEDATPLGEVVA